LLKLTYLLLNIHFAALLLRSLVLAVHLYLCANLKYLIGHLALLQGDANAKHIVASITGSMTIHLQKKLSDNEPRYAVQGLALALGCVHRELGAIRSQSFLKTSLKTLLDLLFKFEGVSDVHLWILHSLLLVVEVTGASILPDVRTIIFVVSDAS
jgi:hypothetical protein